MVARASRRPNIYEEQARLAKALELTVLLIRCGISGDDAAALNEEQWAALAQAAGVKTPGALTISMVIGMVKNAEARVQSAGQ